MQKPEPTLPIFSTRADDPECLEAIERFVVSLAERVDHLQDAQARSQLCELSDQALRLGRDAEQLGFADLGSAAAEIEACCRAEDRTAALKALRALTDVAHRIRLGHRGAS